MVLIGEIKLFQNPKGYTQNITIPSVIVRDSQYPFKGGEELEITVIPAEEKMVVIKKGAKFLGESTEKTLETLTDQAILTNEEQCKALFKNISSELFRRGIYPAHCKKCRREVKMKREKETVVKSGNKSVTGLCLNCGAKITQFVKK